MTTATKTERQAHRALYIGGPPGQTLIKIRARLQAIGIHVEEVAENARSINTLPRWCTCVIVNIDMIDHPSSNKARGLAKMAGAAFGIVHLDWSRTLQSLKNGGFAVDPIIDVAVDDDDKESAVLKNPVKAKMTPEQLQAILGDCDDEATEAAILRAAAGIARRRHVREAIHAVEALDDDGLMDLAAALSQRLRASLKAACEATAR